MKQYWGCVCIILELKTEATWKKSKRDNFGQHRWCWPMQSPFCRPLPHVTLNSCSTFQNEYNKRKCHHKLPGPYFNIDISYMWMMTTAHAALITTIYLIHWHDEPHHFWNARIEINGQTRSTAKMIQLSNKKYKKREIHSKLITLLIYQKKK